jgi:hypothetical protein
MVTPDSLTTEKPASGSDGFGSKPERSSITMLDLNISSRLENEGGGASIKLLRLAGMLAIALAGC